MKTETEYNAFITETEYVITEAFHIHILIVYVGAHCINLFRYKTNDF